MKISVEVREAIAHYRLFVIMRCTSSRLHTLSFIISTVCVHVSYSRPNSWADRDQSWHT